MLRCPITYKPCGPDKYSPEGLKALSPRLRHLADFPYGKEEQLELALDYADKLSFSGVQPKLSAHLKPTQESFEIVSRGGTFLLKPPHPLYPELPENEDLTMKLASIAGIDVPLHGMIYAIDKSLVYFIKRFDRGARLKKIAVEDFAQLAGLSREAKYESSMEKAASLIDQFCTFPLVEKKKLFRLMLFNFLVGNEDMHMKNFSLISEKDSTKLSPAYDLVNSTIASRSKEEIALPLQGKKSNLKRKDFTDFAQTKLSLPKQEIETMLDQLHACLPLWDETLAHSFLSDAKKKQYAEVIKNRSERLHPK